MTNFRFRLLVNGAFEVPLKSVRAFNRENEYEYIQEGGLNDYVHARRKPIAKPYTLVVERYVPMQLDDPLTNGAEMSLPLMLFVGRNTGGSMDNGRIYVFTGAYVMSKEYGGLDAEKGAMMTETITIGYNMMFCITDIEEDTSKPEWQMNEGGAPTTAGNIEQLYSKSGLRPPQNDESEKAFIRRSQLWEFNGLTKPGKGAANAARIGRREGVQEQPEMSKEEMFNKKRRYYFGVEDGKKNEQGSKSVQSAVSAKNSEERRGAGMGIVQSTQQEMIEHARKFEFTTSGEYTGNGQLSSRRNDTTLEPTEEELRGKASRWEFDEKKKKGKGVSSAQNNLVTDHTTSPDGSSSGLGMPEKTKEEMAGSANRFEFTNINEPAGNGNLSSRRNEREIEADKDTMKDSAVRWEFDEKNKDGAGKRSRQNAVSQSEGGEVTGIGVTEPSREEMEKAGHRWAFTDKYTKGGNNVRSAATPDDITENNIDAMIDNASRWEFDGKTKDGAGQRNRQNAQMTGTGNSAEVSGMGVTELSKEELTEASARWEFTDAYTKAGGGVSSRNNTMPPETSEAEMGTKANRKEKFTKPESSQPEARRWGFDESGSGSKAGTGTSSRAVPRVPELSKDQMAAKAVHHVRRSIEDFLMS
ncbi:MAG: phage tail protein [Lachnospiraceae bacterium]|nr:phage tail protein [Lachnospiraceae bacterium]